MTKHTPGPWRVEDRRGAPLKNIRIIAGSHEVAQVSDVHQRDYLGGYEHYRDKDEADATDATGLANAAFIVRAVNCHDDLLAACKNARRTLAGRMECDLDFDKATKARLIAEHPDIVQLDAAIALAEGT